MVFRVTDRSMIIMNSARKDQLDVPAGTCGSTVRWSNCAGAKAEAPENVATHLHVSDEIITVGCPASGSP